MKFRKLESDSELENYRQAIAPHIDVLFPLEYLKQGYVYGYYCDQGQLCGGFALITEGPFRVLESIPDFEEFNLDPHLKNTAEVTGVWLSSKNRTKYCSLKFWIKLLSTILLNKKKYFVYAFSNKKTNLKKLYSKADPVTLFSGETKQLPGMDSADDETVQVILKSRILTQSLKHSDFFLKRISPRFRRQVLPKYQTET